MSMEEIIVMTVREIQKKTKVIQNYQGKSVEVILPYNVYQELLKIKTSMEIYQQHDVQQSLKHAKDDIINGQVKIVHSADEAIEWLK